MWNSHSIRGTANQHRGKAKENESVLNLTTIQRSMLQATFPTMQQFYMYSTAWGLFTHFPISHSFLKKQKKFLDNLFSGALALFLQPVAYTEWDTKAAMIKTVLNVARCKPAKLLSGWSFIYQPPAKDSKGKGRERMRQEKGEVFAIHQKKKKLSTKVVFEWKVKKAILCNFRKIKWLMQLLGAWLERTAAYDSKKAAS